MDKWWDWSSFDNDVAARKNDALKAGQQINTTSHRIPALKEDAARKRKEMASQSPKLRAIRERILIPLIDEQRQEFQKAWQQQPPIKREIRLQVWRYYASFWVLELRRAIDRLLRRGRRRK